MTEVGMLTGRPNIRRVSRTPFPVLVMERIEGGDLFGYLLDLIRDREKITERVISTLFREVFVALSAVHAAGVIHRDLKSDNIMIKNVEGRRVIKIIDFGLGVILEPGQEVFRESSNTVGTPR